VGQWGRFRPFWPRSSGPGPQLQEPNLWFSFKLGYNPRLLSLWMAFWRFRFKCYGEKAMNLVKNQFFVFWPNFINFYYFFTKTVGNHVARNTELSSTLFVAHRVTEHVVSDFACCSYLYLWRDYMFSSLNFRSSTS